MISLAVNTYFHILLVIAIFICLITELRTIRFEITRPELKLLNRMDGIYGVAAILLVISGLLNWFVFGKGSEYYLNNYLFLSKISLFTIVGMLSVYPTVAFARLKKKHKSSSDEIIAFQSHKHVRNIIRLEIAIMTVIPLFAELMANGIDI